MDKETIAALSLAVCLLMAFNQKHFESGTVGAVCFISFVAFVVFGSMIKS